MRVSKIEFDRSDNLVGINHNKKSKLLSCKYCTRQISLENINNHQKMHERHVIYITDNENMNTIKIKESEFYISFKDTHYITGSGMIVYKNGIKVRTRKRKTGPMKKQECPKCGKLIGNTSNYNRHLENHERDKQNDGE